MKYIIEINDTPMTTPELGKKLYKAKGFNSLVFDQNGLDKLEKFETTSMIDKSNFSEEQYRLDIENAHDCGYQEGYANSQATKLEWGDVQYSKGYQEGYDTAIENAQATKLDWGDVQYKKGYNQAINDYKKFEDFFNYGHSEVFEDIRNPNGVLSLNMILESLPMKEIMARIKVYEEKKKAEEETIKVGDVIYSEMSNTKALVTLISEWGTYHCLHSGGAIFTLTIDKVAKYWTKVGHIDEVSQLLDKLRGEDK